jgi:hypothetical protein
MTWQRFTLTDIARGLWRWLAKKRKQVFTKHGVP